VLSQWARYRLRGPALVRCSWLADLERGSRNPWDHFADTCDGNRPGGGLSTTPSLQSQRQDVSRRNMEKPILVRLSGHLRVLRSDESIGRCPQSNCNDRQSRCWFARNSTVSLIQHLPYPIRAHHNFQHERAGQQPKTHCCRGAVRRLKPPEIDRRPYFRHRWIHYCFRCRG
jgi:hypothetical protein